MKQGVVKQWGSEKSVRLERKVSCYQLSTTYNQNLNFPFFAKVLSG